MTVFTHESKFDEVGHRILTYIWCTTNKANELITCVTQATSVGAAREKVIAELESYSFQKPEIYDCLLEHVKKSDPDSTYDDQIWIHYW